jgi:hypothetical protein
MGILDAEFKIAALQMIDVNSYAMSLSTSNMAMCCCAMAMRVFTPRQKGS